MNFQTWIGHYIGLIYDDLCTTHWEMAKVKKC